MRGVFIILVVALLAIRSEAQFPFGQGQTQGLGQGLGLGPLVGDMGNVAADMQAMGMGMAQQAQNMYANILRNAQFIEGMGPGQRVFTTHDGGQGVSFTSPDGSFSTFSFSSGTPSSGFMYYQGPDGAWERRW